MHVIQNHSPSNLNRDEMGNPKSCMFGGVQRARISSQCIKRSIRQSDIFKNEIKGLGESYRTRTLPKLIFNGLESAGVDSNIAEIISRKFLKFGKANKNGSAKKSTKKTTKKKVIAPLQTKQILFFSDKEISNIVKILKKMIEGKTESDIKDLKFDTIEKKMITDHISEITPDIGLFGRMTTSNTFVNIDSAIQVAHAISTNRIEQEFDYFVAVDDLDKKGAGMVGEAIFTSSCYYKYFSFDTDGFLNNLGFYDLKDKIGLEILKKILSGFIKASVFITPSGKQNSYAANQLPDAILINVRSTKIPISYANAFLKPIKYTRNDDLVEASIKALVTEVKKIDEKFNIETSKRLWFNLKDIKMPSTTECSNFDDLLTAINNTIDG